MADSQLLFEEPIHSTGQPSVAELVAGIVSDFKKLLEQQLTLAKHELQQNLQKILQATWLVAIGAVLALLAGVGLLFATAHGVSWAFPSISLGGSLAIVGLVLSALAYCMIHRGLREFGLLNHQFMGSTSHKENQ